MMSRDTCSVRSHISAEDSDGPHLEAAGVLLPSRGVEGRARERRTDRIGRRAAADCL